LPESGSRRDGIEPALNELERLFEVGALEMQGHAESRLEVLRSAQLATH
jgi:hypothetical protein